MEHCSCRSSLRALPRSGAAGLSRGLRAALLLSSVLVAGSLCRAEPDSLNVHLVGNWPFGPAKVAAFDPARNVIFGGSGGGVFILDATDPASLTKISESIHTPGLVRGLDYDPVTRRLYIADGPRGLEVWSVSTLTDPKFLGRCATPGRAIWVRTSGSLAYVACADSGMTVVDATDPSSPHVTGRLRTPGTALRLCIQGHYAYVADWTGGMLVVDVSDPAAPRVTGQFVGGKKTHEVCVRDTTVYVRDIVRGLSVLNVSVPDAPRELGNRPPDGYFYISFMVSCFSVRGSTWLKGYVHLGVVREPKLG